jgi:hypothetical protein
MTSNTQLNVIKKTLDQLGITFLDIQNPMAISIDKNVNNLMISEGLTFENALKKVLLAHESFFVYSKSFYLGIIYNFPKLVLKKLEEKEKKILFNLLKTLVLAGLVFYFFRNMVLEMLTFGNALVLSILVVSLLLFANVNSKKTKTSFRFFINKTLIKQIFFSLLFFLSSTILSKAILAAFVLYYFYVILENYQNHNLFCKTLA